MALPSFTTTIGTVRFMGWKGWIPTWQQQGDRFKRLGATGSGAQVTGESDEPKDYQAWRLFTSPTDAAQFIADVEALPVQTYTITDQWGYTFRFRVWKSSATPRAGKGPGTILVECVINGEYMGEQS